MLGEAIRTVTAPGVYQNVPAPDYHLQLTPAPSMSAGMAIDMITGCPRLVWHNSYLNPEFEPEHNASFDLGTAGHLALLEPDEWASRTAIISGFDDYKKQAARDARDQAYAEGRTPLLDKHVAKIMDLRAAVLADPIAGPAFTGAPSEQTVVWRDRKTGIYCKCRPDKAASDWSWVADLKVTTSANPLALERKADNSGWAQRAEWYLDGIEVVTGIRPSDYFFIVAEVDPPHLVTVCRYRHRLGDKPRALEWASMMNRRAIDVFAECIETGVWPAYTDKVVELDLPSYTEAKFEERRAAGEFTPKAKPRPSGADQRRAAEYHEILRSE